MPRFVKKANLIFVILAAISFLVLLTSCVKPLRTEEIELQNGNVNSGPAWEPLIYALDETAKANSYDVSFKSHKEAKYGEYSSTEDLEHTMKISGIDTENFTATAKKQNLTGNTTNEYFFLNDRFCFTETSGTNETQYRLFFSDNIDVLKEVTGFNVFKLDKTALKAAVTGSKSIKKGRDGETSYVKFALSADEMTAIIGESFEAVSGMDNFAGFMYFYMDSMGDMVKFGYESNYTAVFDGEESSIKKEVEYSFSNVNNVSDVVKPNWVNSLTPDKMESIKCTQKNVDYIFLYEVIDGTNEYGYKLYELINSEDANAKISFAEVPAEINGLPVFAISGTAISFGKGVDVLVLPEHITVVPYPEVSTPMKVFCKCSELTEPAISGTTVYLAGQWEYINGVPTPKR